MSTLINLLPDLRQAKLRERRRRQLVTGISVSIWVACGVIVGLLSVFAGGQKVLIGGVTKNIQSDEQQLQKIDGLVDAMTADQHVAALPGLYDNRVYLTKFFTAYSAASPVSLSIQTLAIDSQNVLTVAGTSPNFAEVAKLARALETSNVKVGAGAASTNTPYFTDVKTTDVENSDKSIVSFTMTATVDGGATHVSH